MQDILNAMPNLKQLSHRSAKLGCQLVGGFLYFVGLSVMWLGASVLLFSNPAFNAGATCTVVCGLITLANAWLGPVAGQVVGGALTLGAGLALALLARRTYQA